MLNIGDSVGAIYEFSKDGVKEFRLVEDKINKIVETKNGRMYHTVKKFRPLDTDDIDSNTDIQERLENCILTKEIFGLNDMTRTKAVDWIEWANNNLDKAVGVLK